MNWEAIGAVGEVCGAIAVVASVLYLAIQVRSAANETRAASVHTVHDSLNRWLITAKEGPVATIWLKGRDDFANLEPVESVQFNALVQVLFRIAEDAYLQRMLGRLPDESWGAFESMFSSVVASVGIQEWWTTRDHLFTDVFREWVREQAEKGAEPLRFSPSE